MGQSLGKKDTKVSDDTSMKPEVKEKIKKWVANKKVNRDLERTTTLLEKITKTESEWREVLSEEQFKICRKKGTEQAFSGKYWDCHDRGNYHCTCCGTPLFSSNTKFDSGTGWPSYYQPLTPESIATEHDTLFFMRRTEVLCHSCDSHLGHVFEDGPEPTGLRYCINSASLVLHKAETS